MRILARPLLGLFVLSFVKFCGAQGQAATAKDAASVTTVTRLSIVATTSIDTALFTTTTSIATTSIAVAVTTTATVDSSVATTTTSSAIQSTFLSTTSSPMSTTTTPTLTSESLAATIHTTSVLYPVPTAGDGSQTDNEVDDEALSVEYKAAVGVVVAILLIIIFILICCIVILCRRKKDKARFDEIHHHGTILSDDGSTTKEVPAFLTAYGEKTFKSDTATFHPTEQADSASIKSDMVGNEDVNSQPLHPPNTYDKLLPRKVSNEDLDSQPLHPSHIYDQICIQKVDDTTDPHNSTSDDEEYVYMSLTNATISDGMQYMNLTNINRDNVQYMNLNNADDGVQYMNLFNANNNDVRYMNTSNPMALCDGEESNDKHQGKSDQLGTTGKQLRAATNSVIYDQPIARSPIITTDHLKLQPNPAYSLNHKAVMNADHAYIVTE